MPPGPHTALASPAAWAVEPTNSVSKTERDAGPWPRAPFRRRQRWPGSWGGRLRGRGDPLKTHTWSSTPAGRAPSSLPSQGGELAGGEPGPPWAAVLLTPVDVEDNSVGWRGLRVPHPLPEPCAGLAPRRAL